MVASPHNDTEGRRVVWLAALLLVIAPTCSSDSPAPMPDAAAADAAPVVADGGVDAGDDLAPDARGGSGGTVRGGTGGSNRGGTGGATGGAGPDAAADGATGDDASYAPPGNDLCQDAVVIPLSAPHVDVSATTLGAKHDRDLPCGAGGQDVFFTFTLTARELVYADTLGATFDTLLAFTDACEGGAIAGPEPSCVDDACGGKQSQVVAVLPPGKHYLVLSGNGAGDVTVRFEHAPVGSGPVAELGAGTASTSGTTSGEGGLSLCEAGGPESSYWWTSCQAFTGGAFMASTCTGTMYDSMLSLQIPRSPAPPVCNDDACMLQAAISTSLPPGAGLHVLAVDGFTPRHKGAFTLSTTRP